MYQNECERGKLCKMLANNVKLIIMEAINFGRFHGIPPIAKTRRLECINARFLCALIVVGQQFFRFVQRPSAVWGQMLEKLSAIQKLLEQGMLRYTRRCIRIVRHLSGGRINAFDGPRPDDPVLWEMWRFHVRITAPGLDEFHANVVVMVCSRQMAQCVFDAIVEWTICG